MSTPGERFARALAAKDFDAAAATLDPHVDFRALTPNRFWEASTPEEVAADVLSSWFTEGDEIEELTGFEASSLADRERVAYRFEGRNDTGPFVVEQQAYYAERDGRITWMRVLCSGFRPS